MKVLRLLVGVFAVISLSACGGKAKDVRDADQMETEGNEKIRSINARVDSMIKDYSINLLPLFEFITTEEKAKDYDWSKLSSDERVDVRNKLLAQLSDCGRVLEIAAHKNMTLSGSGDSFRTIIKNATHYLKSLDAFEADKKAI